MELILGMKSALETCCEMEAMLGLFAEVVLTLGVIGFELA